VLCSLSCVGMGSVVRAASFKLIPQSDASRPPDDCDLWLTGDIKPGDAQTLKTLLGNRYGVRGEPIIACLSSPGGSFAEGLALGDLFVERRIATKILANQECKSACAIAFMTGISYNTGGSDLARSMHVSSRLGFHAPEPKLVPGTYDIEDLQNAYAEAIEGVGKDLLALAGHRDRNWNDQLIKPGLINQMMIVHGKNFFDINTVRRAAEFQIQLEGAANYRAFEIDDARNACENAIAIGAGSGMADYFFKNDIENIARKQIHGAAAYIIDIRRRKNIYCEVTEDKDGMITVLYNMGGGERVIGDLPNWIALPGDTPLIQLAANKFRGIEKPKPAWCSSPRLDSEITICSSRELLKSDALLERLYRERLTRTKIADIPQLREKQNAWIAERNACKKDYVCINAKYVGQIASFENPE
jgi:uncharacterized protein YecT (DUF1311 family)